MHANVLDPRECASELYELMPGVTATDSLKLVQMDRRSIITRLSAAPTDKLLLDIVRSLLSFTIWCEQHASSGNTTCMFLLRQTLMHWAAGLWRGAGYDWAIVVDFVNDNNDLDMSEIYGKTNNTALNLALKRSWVTLSFLPWSRLFSSLPSEILAVIYHWRTTKVR